MLTKLDKLVEPLRTTVTTKVKANAVKQEYEKQDELKRSAMRAVAALMAIPGAGKGVIFSPSKYQIILCRELCASYYSENNQLESL